MRLVLHQLCGEELRLADEVAGQLGRRAAQLTEQLVGEAALGAERRDEQAGGDHEPQRAEPGGPKTHRAAPGRRHDSSNDPIAAVGQQQAHRDRSEEHTSELQSLMRNSYAVFCLKKKHKSYTITIT